MSVHLSINSLQRLCLSWTKTDKSHHGQGKEAVCSRWYDKGKLPSGVNSLKGSEAMIRPQNLLLIPLSIGPSPNVSNKKEIFRGKLEYNIESDRLDSERLRFLIMDRLADRQTFAIVELHSQLKIK